MTPIPLDSVLTPGWAALRFWPKIDMTRRSGCWPWTHSTQGDYGQVGLPLPGPPRRVARSHRVMWRLIVGEIPNDLFVLHECDNPPCCNPSHLFLGTHQDNVNDMHRKGRATGGRTSRPGDLCPASKVSEAIAVEILAQRRAGVPGRTVAREFGLSPAQVSRIFTGKRRGYLHD